MIESNKNRATLLGFFMGIGFYKLSDTNMLSRSLVVIGINLMRRMLFAALQLKNSMR